MKKDQIKDNHKYSREERIIAREIHILKIKDNRLQKRIQNLPERFRIEETKIMDAHHEIDVKINQLINKLGGKYVRKKRN